MPVDWEKTEIHHSERSYGNSPSAYSKVAISPSLYAVVVDLADTGGLLHLDGAYEKESLSAVHHLAM